MSYPPVQDQINSIMARLALIDGQGLAVNQTSFEASTTASIAGLTQDIQESVLALEGMVNAINNSFNQLSAQVDQLLGLSNITYTPVTVTPPTT